MNLLLRFLWLQMEDLRPWSLALETGESGLCWMLLIGHLDSVIPGVATGRFAEGNSSGGLQGMVVGI